MQVSDGDEGAVTSSKPPGGKPTGRPRSGVAVEAGNLSEAEIIAAALTIIRADGIDKLSMRRLSRELGVSAMAPYYYYPDKDALLDAIAGEVLRDVSVPPPDTGTWDQRLRGLIDQVEDRLRTHPGVSDVILDRVLHGQRQIIASVMGILFDAGFDDRSVLLAYSMIHSYLFGRNRASRDDLTVPEDGAIPPEITRAITSLSGLRGHDFYEFGIDTLIAGLRDRLAQQGATQDRTCPPSVARRRA